MIGSLFSRFFGAKKTGPTAASGTDRGGLVAQQLAQAQKDLDRLMPAGAEIASSAEKKTSTNDGSGGSKKVSSADAQSAAGSSSAAKNLQLGQQVEKSGQDLSDQSRKKEEQRDREAQQAHEQAIREAQREAVAAAMASRAAQLQRPVAPEKTREAGASIGAKLQSHRASAAADDRLTKTR